MENQSFNHGGHSTPSRRDFIKTSAITGASFFIARYAFSETAPLKVGIIGCGRRGTGAGIDCVRSSPNIKITAIGDLFPDAIQKCKAKLAQLGDAFQVEDKNCFTGWDNYKGVLETDIDIAILAAPPAFRPQHFQYAIEKNKHVFMEKPVAVDPVGIRSILATGENATEKKLNVVAGTQRRHQKPYLSLIEKIHEGAIGDIVSASCYWIGDYDYYTPVPRDPSWSDMEYQLRNWNYYTWISGDHIVEQHVHNIDVINWVLKTHPIRAIGMGGRQQRTGPEFGHIYDHFFVEFEYPGGIRVTSACRQNKDTYKRVGEYVVGTHGKAEPGKYIFTDKEYPYTGEQNNPYEQEHADLISAIRNDTYINETQAIAESTLTAIMGRMSAYTGEEVTWDWVINESKLNLFPEKLDFGPMPVPPVAIPGETKLI